ncbi:hypothetical protein GQX74_003647 [Glossina fuscipes]|nr:hypothetical protein GQX74_003647 [Glossina fuscipes]
MHNIMMISPITYVDMEAQNSNIQTNVQLRVVSPPALAGCKGGKLTLHRHRHDDYYHRYTEPMHWQSAIETNFAYRFLMIGLMTQSTCLLPQFLFASTVLSK